MAVPLRRKPLIHIFSNLIFLLWCLPYAIVATKRFSLNKLQLPPNVTGPESIAFDLNGQGPYTGVADGRILMYQGPLLGFVDFATTSPKRSKEVCDGKSVASLGATCGRPLGLVFNHRTGEMYIADRYKGLLVVSSKGGLATQLASGVHGMPFEFTNAIDLDQRTGIVYFTDAGSIFGRLNRTEVMRSGNKGARLLKYDPRTKQVTVLLTELSGGNGVAVSKDGAFVVVAEYIAQRIRRFWLSGPKANTSEVLVNLRGHPDNIKRSPAGGFWVAMVVQTEVDEQKLVPMGQRISPNGVVLERVMLSEVDPEYEDVMVVSEIHQHRGGFFVGSPISLFVDSYRLSNK